MAGVGGVGPAGLRTSPTSSGSGVRSGPLEHSASQRPACSGTVANPSSRSGQRPGALWLPASPYPTAPGRSGDQSQADVSALPGRGVGVRAEAVQAHRSATERVALVVTGSLRGQDVAAVLTRVGLERGLPAAIAGDHGPELTSRALDHWAYQSRVGLDFTRPGKPTDHAHIESFNGEPREREPSGFIVSPPGTDSTINNPQGLKAPVTRVRPGPNRVSDEKRANSWGNVTCGGWGRCG